METIEKEKLVYIYGLLDPITDIIRYVGKTDDLFKRYYDHLQEIQDPIKKNYHSKNWLRVLLKQGVAPKIEVLEKCKESIWQKREIFWISFYKLNDLTNMTKGGDGGGMTGKPSHKRLKVDIYLLNGEFVKTCVSLKEAEEFTKVHNGKISSICKSNSRRRSGNGYVFRYYQEPFFYMERNYSNEKKMYKKEIYEVDGKGNIINTFTHANQVSSFYGITRENIQQNCNSPFTPKNKFKCLKNKHFIYTKDYEDIVQSLKKFKTDANDHAEVKQ